MAEQMNQLPGFSSLSRLTLVRLLQQSSSLQQLSEKQEVKANWFCFVTRGQFEMYHKPAETHLSRLETKDN